jgi:hypothetical protein
MTVMHNVSEGDIFVIVEQHAALGDANEHISLLGALGVFEDVVNDVGGALGLRFRHGRPRR